MVKSAPIVWEKPTLITPFRCFIHGCRKQAEHVAKIALGKVVVQVCLCNKCQHKSAMAILRALAKGSDEPRN
jgi:hypothetical protein